MDFLKGGDGPLVGWVLTMVPCIGGGLGRQVGWKWLCSVASLDADSRQLGERVRCGKKCWGRETMEAEGMGAELTEGAIRGGLIKYYRMYL